MAKLLKTVLFLAFSSFVANGYVIYSIAQDIPMGFDKEEVRKNFYVNMGEIQGLKKGTKLSVYRDVVKLDSEDEKKRYAYRIKIGYLEVVHTEDNSAIAVHKESEKINKQIVLDGYGPMVGDTVDVDVD